MSHSVTNNQYDNNLHIQEPGKRNKAGSTNPLGYQRFLNCDVKGFNLNLGFGGAETSMTMDLVESLETGTIQDQTQAEFSKKCETNRGTGPDNCVQLRYNGELGRVYEFKCLNANGSVVFEYAGLLSDHDIKLDSNGRTISIRMTDGRSALENVTLIIGDNYSRNYIYQEFGDSVNVLNILYEAEKGVSMHVDNIGDFTPPANPTIEDPLNTYGKCDYFMDSGYDEDGIPVTYILGQFMSSARYMTLPLSDQLVKINLDNVFNNAVNRAPYMRVNDTSLSLMSLLQQVCEEMAGELVINMIHTAPDPKGAEYEIVATFINRGQKLGSGGKSLRNYIDTDIVSKYAGGSKAFKSLSYGQESSYDATQNVVFGSKVRYFIETQRKYQYPAYNTPNTEPGSFTGGSYYNDLITTYPVGISGEIPLDRVVTQDYTTPGRDPSNPTYVFEPTGDIWNADSCYNEDQFQTPLLGPGQKCRVPTGGGRIAMVLGERLNGNLTNQGIPAYTLYSSNLCGDYLNVTYHLDELCAVLGFANLGTAQLTEDELLFTQTYESYINWSTMHPGSIGYKMGQAIFGSLWGNFQEYSLKIFADIVENGSFDSFRDPALAFPDAEVSKKLFEVVHAYVKNIYDTFYGKEYVVLLDTKKDEALRSNNFDVCIGKSFNTWTSSQPNDGDDDGDQPQPFATVTIPNNDPELWVNNGILANVIKTAGNGYLSTSDTIAQGAWFNSSATSTVLGLGTGDGLARFLNDDNTIGSFVKYGPIDNICKRIGNQTFVFRVDLSALNPSEFLVNNGNLYLKASVNEEMYFGGLTLTNNIVDLFGLSFAGLADDKTWVRFSIPRVKLIPTSDQDAAVNRAASRMALIALQVMTDVSALSGVVSGEFSLRDAITDKLAGGGINPGTFDGIAANLAVTNLAKMSVPAIVPEAIAIPFQSETVTYGPWMGISNPSGGMNVTEEDLAPWHFGFGPNAPSQSFQLMSNHGLAFAKNGLYGRMFQEKATIEAAGIPQINIAAATTDDSATVLTDISFGYGGDGAKTTMTYQSYSPKFGTAPKYLADSAKQTIGQKLEYMKKFRAEAIKNTASSLKLKEDLTKIIVGRNIGGGGGGGAGVEASDGNSRYGHTPSKFLMCGYLNKNKVSDIENSDGGSDGSAASQAAHDYTDGCEDIDNNPFPYSPNSPSPNDGNTCNRYTSAEIHPSYHFDSYQKEYYKNLSMMSMDGLYLPISIEGGPNNNLARYTTYSTPSSLPKGRPITMMPPVDIASAAGLSDSTAIDLTIDQKYNNPICSKAILNSWDDRKNDSDQGFVIMNVAHGSDADDNFNFDKIGASGTTGVEYFKDRQLETDFRFTAMRGPLVLQAWGYDINGKPIPNANDSAQNAEAGTFRNTQLEDKFLKNWLSNPKTWPVGPIDLRWDRNRGMWVAPPSSKIIPARLTAALSPFGSTTAELLNPNTFYEDYPLFAPDGTELTADVRNLTVTVHDYIGSSITKCAIVLLYYSDGKFMVIEEGGTRNLQRARISSGQTLACNGQCRGELFTVSTGGGVSYGDIGAITISDVMGIVSQPLASLTRLWVYKPSDTSNYEVVYIGSRSDADCGSCGGYGVYQIAGVDFNRLPTVQTVGKVLSVTEGGCLALVGTKNCGGITTP